MIISKRKIFFIFFLTVVLSYVILYYACWNYCLSPFTAFDVEDVIVNTSCVIQSTDDLIRYGWHHKYRQGIPKIVHYVYKNYRIPSQYSPYVQQCMDLNKDAKFVFWTDKTASDFVNEHFPNSSFVYKSYFRKNFEALKISDINRYFLLLKFGGIYMDLDTKCQKPFGTVMNDYSCVLSREIEEQTRILWDQEYFAMNSFMACTSNHNFFKHVVNSLKKNDGSFIISLTGPSMLTQAYRDYIKLNNQFLDGQSAVVLADSYVFSPHSEVYLEQKCKKVLTGKWQIQGCINLANHRMLQKLRQNDSVVVHLLMHLGYKFSYYKIKKRNFICEDFVNINVVAK